MRVDGRDDRSLGVPNSGFHHVVHVRLDGRQGTVRLRREATSRLLEIPYVDPREDPANVRTEPTEEREAGRELSEIRQGDRVNRSKVIPHASAIGQGHHDVAWLEALDRGSDGAGVGDHAAQDPTEKPASAGKGRQPGPERAQARSRGLLRSGHRAGLKGSAGGIFGAGAAHGNGALQRHAPVTMVYLIQAILGGLVWSVANVVYLDMKRKGLRGFTRFAAFWAGTPTTWITFFAVPEGSTPTFNPPEEDEEQRLFDAIRRDRATRALGPAEETREDEATPEDSSAPGAPLAKPQDRA